MTMAASPKHPLGRISESRRTNFPVFSKQAWFVFLVVVDLSTRLAFGSGCVGEGPCGVDRYCSPPPQDICRPCEVIASHYCQNRTAILERFPTCDAYCFQVRLNKAESQLEEKDNLIHQLKENITNTVPPVCPPDNRGQLDRKHFVLFGLIALLLVVIAVLVVYICRGRHIRNGTTSDGRTTQDRALEDPEGIRLLNSTETTQPTAPPTELEDGYETGVSGSSTTTPGQTPPPDRASEATPRTRESTDLGHSLHNPTTEDSGPPELAL